MISQNTISFLKELKNNNTKEWFDNNRDRYKEARKEFLDQMNNLIEIAQQIDPFVGQVDAKKTQYFALTEISDFLRTKKSLQNKLWRSNCKRRHTQISLWLLLLPS